MKVLVCAEGYVCQETTDGRFRWCNVHERRANFEKLWEGFRAPDGEWKGRHEFCCDPESAGILMPCSVVDLTGIATIEET